MPNGKSLIKGLFGRKGKGHGREDKGGGRSPFFCVHQGYFSVDS